MNHDGPAATVAAAAAACFISQTSAPLRQTKQSTIQTKPAKHRQQLHCKDDVKRFSGSICSETTNDTDFQAFLHFSFWKRHYTHSGLSLSRSTYTHTNNTQIKYIRKLQTHRLAHTYSRLVIAVANFLG